MRPDHVKFVKEGSPSVVVDNVASIPVHFHGVATSRVISILLVTTFSVVFAVAPFEASFAISNSLLECGKVLAFIESRKVASLVVETRKLYKTPVSADLGVPVVDDGLVKGVLLVGTPAVHEFSAVVNFAKVLLDDLPSFEDIQVAIVVEFGVAGIIVPLDAGFLGFSVHSGGTIRVVARATVREVALHRLLLNKKLFEMLKISIAVQRSQVLSAVADFIEMHERGSVDSVVQERVKVIDDVLRHDFLGLLRDPGKSLLSEISSVPVFELLLHFVIGVLQPLLEQEQAWVM